MLKEKIKDNSLIILYSSINTACITNLFVPLLLQVDRVIILSSAFCYHQLNYNIFYSAGIVTKGV